MILTVLTSLTLEGESQTIDTICLPLNKVQEIFVAAEQKKVLDKEVVVYKSDIQLLLERLSNKDARLAEKDSAIADFRFKDAVNQSIVKTFQSEIDILQSEKADYKKALRKQKTKTVLGGVAGLIGGFLVVILLSK